MALTKHSESAIVYLQVKHFTLWREIKKYVEGCETVEVNNPKTGEKVIKYGYKFDTVEGRAVQCAKYDTGKQYSTRYFGFKLHIQDGVERYVIDMPYNSPMLRRFLRVAPRLDWTQPFSITVFPGKGKNPGDHSTGIWFQQNGETVKPYFTREEPHGMPDATYDDQLQQWDFRAQHRWLVEKLQEETIPAIAEAARRFVAPVERDVEEAETQAERDSRDMPPFEGITDDDIPF